MRALTQQEINTIWDYCIGGNKPAPSEMEREVIDFLNREYQGDIDEALNDADQVKGFESHELAMSGYYDY